MNRGRRRGRAVPRYGAGRLSKLDGVWVFDYRDEHGNRRRDRLGTNKREAEELRADIISKRNRVMRGLDVGFDDLALDDLRHRYLADLGARTTPMHRLNVELQLGKILDAIPSQTVGELRPAQFLDYRAVLLRDGASNRTCNVHLQAIRGMLSWAVKMELIAKNPLLGIEKLPDGKRHQRYRRRALTEEEIERLLRAVETEDEVIGRVRKRVRQTPMWRTLLETGVRYGEMRQLVWQDLDEERGLLHVRAETAKAGRDRVIPLRPELVKEIASLQVDYWKLRGRKPGPCDPIFVTPREAKPWCLPSNNAGRTLARIMKKAGVEAVDGQGRKVDLHGLRHSFVSRLGRLGVPLVHAQRLAGHSDPRLTAQAYMHVEIEELRGAIELLPGRTPGPTVETKGRAAKGA